MVCGVKVINGKIFVSYYKSILDVPKDEVSKYPEEVRDYVEYELLRKPRPEKK
jgi:hypothetical protein